MPDIRAIIFDAYETLAENHASLWLPTFDRVCDEQMLPLTGQQLWDMWKPLEVGFRYERVQLDNLDNTGPYKTYERAWLECFDRVFTQIGKGDAAIPARQMILELGRRQLYPESMDVLALLKASGRFCLGLLSNADNDSLMPLLKLHDLEFDHVISSEMARVYKPHPMAFHLISEALDVPPEASLFVGDSQFDDVQGAGLVGMHTVWVNRNGSSIDTSLPRPEHEVRDLTGLLEVLGMSSAR